MADGGERRKGQTGTQRAKEAGARLVDPNEETAPRGIDRSGPLDPDVAADAAGAASADAFPPGRCQLCGWRNVPSAILCEGCGSDLQTGEPPPVERFRPRRFDMRILVVAQALAVAVAVGIGARALIRSGADERALARAEALRREGRAADAVPAFREAVALNGKNARAWSGLAETLLLLGERSPAREAARLAVQTDPSLPEAHAALGRALLEPATDVDEALQHLRAAHSLKPDLPDLQHLIAHALFLKNDRREARTRYREALVRDPRSREAALSRLRLGTLLVQLNLLNEAQEQLQLAAEGGAPLGEVKAALGDLESRRGELGRALELYEEALAANPRDAWVHYRVARILHRHEGRAGEALGHVQEALGIEPEQPSFLKLEGMVLEELGQDDAAYRSYLAAAGLSRRDPEVLRLLAAIDRRQGRLGEARDNLERARDLDPTSVETLVELAEVQGQQRDSEAQRKSLERAARLDTQNAEVQYRYGNALLRAGERSDAIAALARAADADRRFQAPRALLIQLYRDDGRFDEAAPVLEELVRLRPDDLDLPLDLARLWINHCTVRRYDAAIELLQRVLQQDPDLIEAERLIRQAQSFQLREGG